MAFAGLIPARSGPGKDRDEIPATMSRAYRPCLGTVTTSQRAHPEPGATHDEISPIQLLRTHCIDRHRRDGEGKQDRVQGEGDGGGWLIRRPEDSNLFPRGDRD